MRISDWSSDVCSSDLLRSGRNRKRREIAHAGMIHDLVARRTCRLKIRLEEAELSAGADHRSRVHDTLSSSRLSRLRLMRRAAGVALAPDSRRSEEHKSELLSLMSITDAVF